MSFKQTYDAPQVGHMNEQQNMQTEVGYHAKNPNVIVKPIPSPPAVSVCIPLQLQADLIVTKDTTTPIPRR